jgi:hypothetical protein
VKETGWNDGVAGPEQRGVLSVGRVVCYTTVIWTQLYRMEGISFSKEEATTRDEDQSLAAWKEMNYTFSRSLYLQLG